MHMAATVRGNSAIHSKPSANAAIPIKKLGKNHGPSLSIIVCLRMLGHLSQDALHITNFHFERIPTVAR